jgi:hypothetical protein
MKRKTLFILLVGLVLTACQSKKEETISTVAYGYCKAMGDYQFDNAIPYASKITKEITIPYFKKMLLFSDTTLLFTNRPATITIKKVEITSDSTALALYHKHTPIKEIDDTVRLILEDGQWVVHAPIKNAIPIAIGNTTKDFIYKNDKLNKDIEKEYKAKLKARKQHQGKNP